MQTKYEIGDVVKTHAEQFTIATIVIDGDGIGYASEEDEICGMRENLLTLIQPVGSPFKVGCTVRNSVGMQYQVTKIERNSMTKEIELYDAGGYSEAKECTLIVINECSTVERHNEDLRNCLNAIGDALKLGGSFSYFSLAEKVQELMDANVELGRKCSRLESKSSILDAIAKLIGLPLYASPEEVLRRLQRAKKLLSEGTQYFDI